MSTRGLRKFFLRVHPDFFHSSPEKQKANSESFKQLLSVVRWNQALQRGGTPLPPPFTHNTFKFHCMPKGKDSSHSKEVTATLNISALGRKSTNKQITEFFASLFLQAGIDRAPEENKQEEPKRVLIREPSLQDTVVSQFQHFWAEARTPTVEQLLEADMLFTMKTLSPDQTSEGLANLQDHLEDMEYHRWYGVSILIGHQFSASDIDGFITIPWNFQLSHFLEFIREYDETLQEKHQNLWSQATQMEDAIRELETTFNLHSLLTPTVNSDYSPPLLQPDLLDTSTTGTTTTTTSSSSSSTTEDTTSSTTMTTTHNNNTTTALQKWAWVETVAPAVQHLLHCKDTLKKYNLSGLCIELGDAFAIRRNGVICLDSNELKKDKSDTLVEFLEGAEYFFEDCRQKIQVAQDTSLTAQHHVNDVETALHATVDLTHASTLHEKLRFSRELHKCHFVLLRYNWVGWTFAMGHSMDFDWESQTVTLPPDFDAVEFLAEVKNLLDAAVQPENTLMNAAVHYDSAMTKHTVPPFAQALFAFHKLLPMIRDTPHEIPESEFGPNGRSLSWHQKLDLPLTPVHDSAIENCLARFFQQQQVLEDSRDYLEHYMKQRTKEMTRKVRHSKLSTLKRPASFRIGKRGKVEQVRRPRPAEFDGPPQYQDEVM